MEKASGWRLNYLLFALAMLCFAYLLVNFSQLAWQRTDAVNAAIPFLVAVAAFVASLLATRPLGHQRLALVLLLLFLVRLGIAAHYHEWWWAKHGTDLLRNVSGYDALRYDDGARQVVSVGWGNAQISSDYLGIVAFYAGVYWVFGYNPLFATVFNTLLGGLAALLIYRLAQGGTAPRVAAWSAIVAMIIPDMVMYGGLLMKEMLVLFLFLLGLWSWRRYQETQRWIALVPFALALAALREVRIAYLYLLVATAGIQFMLERRKSPRRVIVMAGLAIVIAVVAVSGVSNSVRGHNLLSLDYVLNMRQLLDQAAVRVAGESANPTTSLGLRTAVVPSEPATYVFIPVRFMTLYLLPSVWLWGTEPDFAPFLELGAVLIWASLPAVIWGTWRLIRGGQVYLWLPFLLGTLVVSSATPFVDTRLKVDLLPLYFLIACVGFDEVRRWRQLYLPYSVAIVGVAAAYYGVKAYLGG